MGFSRFTRSIVVSALLVLLAGSLAAGAQSHGRGRKYKAPPPTSRIDITIVRRDDGKPIENAAVIFHLEGDKGNMELKTNYEGKTYIDVLPTGSKVLLQIIAKGYQTYGHAFDLDKDKMAIEVRLNRPGKQYSIYEEHKPAGESSDGQFIVLDPNQKDDDKSGDSAKDNPAPPASAQPQPQ